MRVQMVHRGGQFAHHALVDDEHDGSASDQDGDEGLSKVQDGDALITRTSFDAYFLQQSASVQTSSHVFSNLLPPLSQGEYSAAIQAAMPRTITLEPAAWSAKSRKTLFSQFGLEINEGYNLIFYGFGSKRLSLNQFATEHCSKMGHVVVANGFQPDFNLKDLVASIERVPGITSLSPPSAGIEGQIRRINTFFADPPTHAHLYIIIHNIDAPPFRAARSRSCLSLWALNAHIHLVASIDHLNAPLLWSSSDSSTRKPASVVAASSESRAFAWLWHDMTTLAPYDFELSFANRSAITGASTIHTSAARKLREGGGNMSGQSGSQITETAALHVLASVTQKAQRLFALIGERQLEKVKDRGDSSNDTQQNSFSYDMLFAAARDNFIATNDTALRALLGEFRDHGLVVGTQANMGGGGALWIPLRKDRLTSVLASIRVD